MSSDYTKGRLVGFLLGGVAGFGIMGQHSNAQQTRARQEATSLKYNIVKLAADTNHDGRTSPDEWAEVYRIANRHFDEVSSDPRNEPESFYDAFLEHFNSQPENQNWGAP